MTFQGRWVSVLPHVATKGAEVKFPPWMDKKFGSVSKVEMN
jgi:hypothetical protein